jgi:hypothetical protein
MPLPVALLIAWAGFWLMVGLVCAARWLTTWLSSWRERRRQVQAEVDSMVELAWQKRQRRMLQQPFHKSKMPRW